MQCLSKCDKLWFIILWERFAVQLENVTLTKEIQPMTNTVAYYIAEQATKKKSFYNIDMAV